MSSLQIVDMSLKRQLDGPLNLVRIRINSECLSVRDKVSLDNITTLQVTLVGYC